MHTSFFCIHCIAYFMAYFNSWNNVVKIIFFEIWFLHNYFHCSHYKKSFYFLFLLMKLNFKLLLIWYVNLAQSLGFIISYFDINTIVINIICFIFFLYKHCNEQEEVSCFGYGYLYQIEIIPIIFWKLFSDFFYVVK